MNIPHELNQQNLQQIEGAKQAKELLAAIQAEVQISKGDFAIKTVASMISEALDTAGSHSEAERFGFATALGDFIGSTLEGCQPSIEEWNPLSRLESA